MQGNQGKIEMQLENACMLRIYGVRWTSGGAIETSSATSIDNEISREIDTRLDA